MYKPREHFPHNANNSFSFSHITLTHAHSDCYRPDKMMNSIHTHTQLMQYNTKFQLHVTLLSQTSLWYHFVLAKKAGIICSRHT